MKLIMTLAILGLASVTNAAQLATCPSGSKALYACESTPKGGDHEIAVTMLDSITICQSGQEHIFVATKNGEQNSDKNVLVESRTGGTTYSIMVDPIKFSLSVTSGIRSRKNMKARFTIEFTDSGIVSSSTYTCNQSK